MSIARTGLGAEVHLPQQLEGQVEVSIDSTAPHYVGLTVADRPGIIALWLRSCRPMASTSTRCRASRPRQSRAAVRDDARDVPGVGAPCGAAEINALPIDVWCPITLPVLGKQQLHR